MHILTRSSAVVAAVSLSVVALGVGPASAHVRVSSADAAPGGYGELTFRVPTESDTASTVELAVQLPSDTPIGSVSVKPVPGWTAATETTTLATPVTVHGSEVTEAVTEVTWTAGPGAAIAPGQYQTFTVLAGPLPDTETLALPAVQTYDDGTEVAWIEPTVDGQEPEHPAPVLTFAAAGGAAQGVAADSAADTTAISAATARDDGPSGVAVTGLVVAVLALLAALASLVTGLRARRTTGA